MSGVGRSGQRRVYFFWCDPLTAAVRIVMCAAVIFAARRWVPGAVEAFMRLDPVAQGRAAALAVIVAALAWLINGAVVIMIRCPVPPAPADGEQRFERWVDAQLEAGQDRRAAAQRLRPTWEAWQARGRIDGPGRARHEAAHAVVARALGHTVTCADIRHAGDRGGRVESVPPLPSRGAGPDLWDALTITVAGNVLDLAEGRHNISSRDDIRAAETIAAAMISTGHAPDPDAPPRTIARATDDARARANWILITHKNQVNALAAALIERRALTGRQVHDLLQRQPEKK